jgi:AraC-like DNA-binding protein
MRDLSAVLGFRAGEIVFSKQEYNQKNPMEKKQQHPPLDRLPLHTDSISLQDDFPVSCSGVFHHTDRPITFLQRHRIIELGYCHSGRGIFIVGRKTIRFRPGDVFFIPAEENHIARSDPGTESVWHWIHCDPLLLVKPLLDDFSIADVSRDTWQWSNLHYPRRSFPRINELMRSIIDELEKKEEHWRNVVRSQFYTLFVLLRRYRANASRHEGEKPEVSSQAALWPRIKPALEYMGLNYGEEIDIDTLAHACNMSVTNFRRVFLLSTGKSPHDYLSNLRISTAAMELRSSTRKITDIALSCGFPTPSSFNRAFRQIMKVTPKQWRR